MSLQTSSHSLSLSLLITLTTPLLNLIEVIKSGSLVILLLDACKLFKFLSSFKVFGKLVNELWSILSSSNLRNEKKEEEDVCCCC
jgi:hypothetical protein